MTDREAPALPRRHGHLAAGAGAQKARPCDRHPSSAARTGSYPRYHLAWGACPLSSAHALASRVPVTGDTPACLIGCPLRRRLRGRFRARPTSGSHHPGSLASRLGAYCSPSMSLRIPLVPQLYQHPTIPRNPRQRRREIDVRLRPWPFPLPPVGQRRPARASLQARHPAESGYGTGSIATGRGIEPTTSGRQDCPPHPNLSLPPGTRRTESSPLYRPAAKQLTSLSPAAGERSVCGGRGVWGMGAGSRPRLPHIQPPLGQEQVRRYGAPQHAWARCGARADTQVRPYIPATPPAESSRTTAGSSPRVRITASASSPGGRSPPGAYHTVRSPAARPPSTSYL